MDIDAFVARHSPEWDRLDELTRRARRPGRLSGAEVDELVVLYQRAAAHLSVVQTRTPEPLLLARLSRTVARARAVVTAQSTSTWRGVSDFFTRRFPAALYTTRWWWGTAGVAFVVVAFAIGAWLVGAPEVRATLATPEEVDQLVNGDFENYYSEQPAHSFASLVWTNNARIALMCIAFGILLGLPVVFLLWQNAGNVAVSGALMWSAGKGDVFFGLITPHGLLELTAVFVAAGVGLRLGWRVIDPGRQSRTAALAREGRAAVGIGLGLIVVLLVSGVIEAFVTPSPLPTWARISIGVLAWLAFLAYALVLGGRAHRAGDTGDLAREDAGDLVPEAG